MKTSDFAKHVLGMGGAVLATILLAAGFATATNTRHSQIQAFTKQGTQAEMQPEVIAVTATRLVSNRVAKANAACQTATC